MLRLVQKILFPRSEAGGRTIWDFWSDRYEDLLSQRYSLGPARRLVREHVAVHAPRARRILDLGCGVGQLAHELAGDLPDAEVVGVDSSEGMIARARRDYVRRNVTFVLGSYDTMACMPEGPGAEHRRFDVIACTHVFPYLPDKAGALNCLHGLLEPGGRLLVVQANDEGFYDRTWLSLVKLTTAEAEFLPTRELRRLQHEAGFLPGVVRSAQKPLFVPSIYLVEGIRPMESDIAPEASLGAST